MFWCEIFNILFSYEDEDIDRFSNLHYCTFKYPWFKNALNWHGKIILRLWVITDRSLFDNTIPYSNWKINFYLQRSITSGCMFLWWVLSDLSVFSYSWSARTLGTYRNLQERLARHLQEHDQFLNLLLYHRTAMLEVWRYGSGGNGDNGGIQITIQQML